MMINSLAEHEAFCLIEHDDTGSLDRDKKMKPSTSWALMIDCHDDYWRPSVSKMGSEILLISMSCSKIELDDRSI